MKKFFLRDCRLAADFLQAAQACLPAIHTVIQRADPQPGFAGELSVKLEAPAMVAGVTDRLWGIGDIVKVLEDWEAAEQ